MDDAREGVGEGGGGAGAARRFLSPRSHPLFHFATRSAVTETPIPTAHFAKYSPASRLLRAAASPASSAGARFLSSTGCSTAACEALSTGTLSFDARGFNARGFDARARRAGIVCE